MTEPEIALTDYGLAAECAVLAAWLARGGGARRPLGRRWLLFFGAGAVAAAVGGTVHGFVLDAATAGARLLWPLTLLAVGVSTAAAYAVAARLLLAPVAAGVAEAVVAAAGLGYAAAVAVGIDAFGLAVAAYLPAAVLLLAAFLGDYRRTGERPLLAGLLGVLATFVGAAVQSAGHNALYHAVQAAALLGLYAAARRLVLREEPAC